MELMPEKKGNLFRHSLTKDNESKVMVTESELLRILRHKEGKPIKETAVSWRLEKYCKHLGILHKSPHKIRKTYISTLIDDGINIDTIRRLAGHEDERTTYGSYCYDRHSSKQIEAQLENALCMKEVSIFDNGGNYTVQRA